MAKNKTFPKFMILVTAAGIGAAAGLLYAPKDGQRTRRDLRRFATRRWDSVERCVVGTRKLIQGTSRFTANAVRKSVGDLKQGCRSNS
jgi:gas vesicle protein